MKTKYFLNKKKMRRNIIYFICCVREIIKQRNKEREIYKLNIILFNFFYFFQNKDKIDISHIFHYIHIAPLFLSMLRREWKRRTIYSKLRNYLFLWEESSSHREWGTQCGTYDRAQPVRERRTIPIRVNNFSGKRIPCFFIKLTNKEINKLLLKSICFFKKEF